MRFHFTPTRIVTMKNNKQARLADSHLKSQLLGRQRLGRWLLKASLDKVRETPSQLIKKARHGSSACHPNCVHSITHPNVHHLQKR
jgi:hypothetical protein